MCGVPFHSAEGYINRRVERGYKVAICEQVEDPKLAKGLVKRDVIRIVTPGTNCFTDSLDETCNNYLMGIVATGGIFGISVVDVTTGEYKLTEVDTLGKLLDEINTLGVGPQGFGGRTTALAVNIEHCPTHIAGLPVAVNINCHVTRHMTEVL